MSARCCPHCGTEYPLYWFLERRSEESVDVSRYLKASASPILAGAPIHPYFADGYRVVVFSTDSDVWVEEIIERALPHWQSGLVGAIEDFACVAPSHLGVTVIWPDVPLDWDDADIAWDGDWPYMIYRDSAS